MSKKTIRTALKKALAKVKTGDSMSSMTNMATANLSAINPTGLTTITLPNSISANTISVAAAGNIGAGYNTTMWNSNGVSNMPTYITGTNLTSNQTSIVSISNSGKEIVRINKDGSVTWDDDATVDEAAEAFGKSLALGAELSAGLTYTVKQRMRDAVFEEMISLAKEKGSLTAEDLTYLHTAAKIMDKLKGKE